MEVTEKPKSWKNIFEVKSDLVHDFMNLNALKVI